MRTTTALRTTVAVGALTAALGLAGHAAADQAPTPAKAAAKVAATGTGADATDRTSVERQHGVVLEGTADLAGTPVMVTVYDNPHGSSVQVVLGDPEDDVIGYVERATPFVVDGMLDVTVDVQGRELTLRGTVTPSGRPERIVEPLQDAAEQLVTRGTNTQLETHVTVQVDGQQATVDFAPAFAYDLEVRRTSLYGG
jgi:hypothetical protein